MNCLLLSDVQIVLPVLVCIHNNVKAHRQVCSLMVVSGNITVTILPH